MKPYRDFDRAIIFKRREQMLKGIDVSEFQSKIDWDKAREEVDFAILRLGWVGNYGFQKDKYFEEYYAECKRLQIPIGVYVYNYAATPNRMIKCAEWTLEQLEGKELDLPVYLDMEDPNLACLGKTTLTEICCAFNSVIENKFWAGVYANLNWFNNYLNKDEIKRKYTTWIAHYGVSENKYAGEYDMLQYTSDGSIPGIKGRVDLNVMYRDLVTEIDACRNTNKKKMDFLGITRFHECGYKGAGIKLYSKETNTTTHGGMVESILMQIAPEADIKIKQDYKKGTDADVYTTSVFYPSDTYPQSKDEARKLYADNVFLCCAVGNYGTDRQTNLSNDPWWVAIGACDLVKGMPQRMYYSSITEDIDFVSLTNFDTQKGKFTGTSCATPVFAAMCALVQQFFKVNLGRKLTNYELLGFIQENCIDMYEEGHDDKTGSGLFVLPDPSKIDLSKYNEDEEEEDMVLYNKMEEVPEWGKEAVEKALKAEVLRGVGVDEDGSIVLGLTKTELKTIVWFDRLGLLNK